MKEVHPKEFEQVVALPAPDRYEHFINTVADWEEAWGLYEDGWLMAVDDDGNRLLPLWPAKAYADACASGEWSGYEARLISTSDLLAELLPNTERDGVLIAVFSTPEGNYIDVPSAQLREDLASACEEYE